MWAIVIIVCIIILIYVGIAKGLPVLLSWLCYKRFQIYVNIGRIGILSLSLKSVLIRKNGIEIAVDSASVTSSLINKAVSKLLVLHLTDVRIEKSSDERSNQDHAGKTVNLDLTNFLKSSKLQSLLAFSQIFAVHVTNVDVIILRAILESLLQITIQQVRLEGRSENSLCRLSLHVIQATCKILQPTKTTKHNYETRQPCLAEVAFSKDLTAVFDPEQGFDLKEISLSISPEFTISEGLGIASQQWIAKTEDSLEKDVQVNTRNEFLATQLWTYLPNKMKLDLSSVKIKLGLGVNHRTLTCNVKSIETIINKGQLTNNCQVALDQLHLSNGTVALLTLSNAALYLEFSPTQILLKFLISSFNPVYHEDEIKYWGSLIPTQKRSPHIEKKVDSKTFSFISLIPMDCRVQIIVEMSDVSVALHSPFSSSVYHAGFTHSKFSLDLLVSNLQETCPLSRYLSNNLVGGEILWEIVWCHVEDRKLFFNQNKKHHYWNTILYLGVALIKIDQLTHELRVQGMIDNLQLEWNSILTELIIRLAQNLKLKEQRMSDGFIKNEETPEFQPEADLRKKQMSYAITLTNCNIFCITHNKVCLMVRIDTSTIEQSLPKFSLAISGIKANFFPVGDTFYSCIRSTELKQSVLSSKEVSLLYEPSNREFGLHFAEGVEVIWSPALHLTLWQMVQDVACLKSNFRVDTVHTPTSESSALWLSVRVQKTVSVTLVLSAKHSLTLSTGELAASINDQSMYIQATGDVAFNFDGNDIFVFEESSVTYVPVSEQLKADRATFPSLILKENSACIINVASLKVSFPYNYSFAEAFSEEGIGMVKFVKSLHGKKRQNLETSLPPDLLLRIQTFHLEVADDPFEVKLRDNYELLEDEYVESKKRSKMMDSKVEELRKTNLLLPTAKVEELYMNLDKHSTSIYIQRSRQMYSTPMRSWLGMWDMTDIEILALADLSYHGKERVVQQMNEMDPESPYPEEGLEFSTLWCRKVRFGCNSWTCILRDYPNPVLDMKNLHAWGGLVGAEQQATPRAKRTVFIAIDDPWGGATIERSLPSLKFYYDLSCEVENFVFGYGPCWEPAFSYLTSALEMINKPSSDPSPPLPFWDKMRLLYHGRLTMFVQQMALVLHASLDPYNTTEEMDFTWFNFLLDWTNGKVVLKGDLDVYVRTASKYDDCRLLHMPNLKLTIKMDWLCLADPNDHHSVMPCAPDKIPEYSSNQQHDSYRAFRSINLNLSIAIETKSMVGGVQEAAIPTLLLYSSTLRWLECLKVILSGISRPIKRGALFHNCKPRKLQLSRHYKTIRVSLSLHQFDVCYWMSFAKSCGFHLKAGKLSLSSEHNLNLVAVNDGLKHRSQREWSTAYMNCELNDVQVWLKSAPADTSGNEMNRSFQGNLTQCYFVSLTRISYGRESMPHDYHVTEETNDTPTHCLVIHDLKGAWTKGNRDIVFNLFDSYVSNKLLRRNLSTEALKNFKVESSSLLLKPRGNSTVAGTASPHLLGCGRPLQSSPAITMLQMLIAEADSNATVFSEELVGNTREQQLHGVVECQTDDVLHKNWLIELVNSQVMLKGSETSGYVIMSAAKAQILQRIHLPAWRDCSLATKTTWVGLLECMQYYATVDPGELSLSLDNIQWLTVDNIEEKESMVVAELPDLVGSGQGVGGVVSGTVGGADAHSPVQLQRIVSRCSCQFFYASYGENVDPKNFSEVPSLPPEDSDLWTKEVPVDSFTLTHHDLNCCTNSLQYAMILDIINNILLHVELKKKEANERLQRMRFQLQLTQVEDQRTPILQLQNQVRNLLSNMRRLEKEMYLVQRDSEEPNELVDDLEEQIYECKMHLSSQADELAMMISCFKEQQLLARRMSRTRNDQKVTPRRWNEVCFKHAQWRLTETDGQLGIADVAISNFLYSKQTKNDHSVEHLLELGYIKVTNLIPNQIYKDVLQPTTLQGNIPPDRYCALRIFCREKPPVGGISIKEHLEVNVVPLTLRLTSHFYGKVEKFCFPSRDIENLERQSPEDADCDTRSLKKLGQQRRGASNDDQDDIDKMKERAEKNKMFLYIKIPEVPVCLSYKADKENPIKDIHNFNLVVPTLEYHDVTWTWRDLLTATKTHSKKALVSQAIKQKLQIKGSKAAGGGEDGTLAQDKAKLLMGTRVQGPTGKKGSLFGRSGKH